MARYRESVCRLCRRESTKLHLKGERCYSDNCAVERRSYPPGEHGRRRKGKLIRYGLQLREKQKVKRIYGVLEKQFRLYFKKAERQKGITGENLLTMLERRLDNVVYRLNFASSRAQARQLVRHGHLQVDERKVSIPSFLVSEGGVISVAEKSRKLKIIQDALELEKSREVPGWLEIYPEEFKGKVVRMPTREDITFSVQEQLIVELYSK
ncbi:MAG: 30S ribosomal protein S4 [Candidatus Aminicenantes bacterium]|nr:30S ribosomal protein S4 [Candidatus Aminicenantes bacterium]MDH5714279.1 30S ribosomal protein S4 [Candidatus Aminicenantes bacterium]